VIRQIRNENAWVLETQNTGYCIAMLPNVDEVAPADGQPITIESGQLPDSMSSATSESVRQPHDDVVHLYWGRRLPRLEDYAQAVSVAQRSSFNSKAWLSPLEYRPWTGGMYEEPSLKVRFPDGSRNVVLVFDRAHLGQSESLGPSSHLVLYFSDVKGLEVRLHYVVREHEDMVVRWVEVTNVSASAHQLTQLSAAVWNLPDGGVYRATTVHGDWGREFQLQRQLIQYGKHVMESRKGHTSHDANPFFMVDNGLATEHSGAVWFGALEWSGNWKIAFDVGSHHRLSISGGFNDFDFEQTLLPRQSIISPKFAAGYTVNGFGGASRNLHRYAHSIQDNAGTKERPVPVLYNSWEATGFEVTEKSQMQLAKIAADIGVELFVVDDGWFGARNSDRAGLGDWTTNSEKFPRGLSGLAQYVEDLGMRFGIWVEPEMVNPDSDLYRNHPDWVLHVPGRDRTLARHQLVLDLSNTAVLDYLFSCLDELLEQHKIRFVKWDMNRTISEPGSTALSPQQQMEVWKRHVDGLYGILERLRMKHPQVVFESCSGGGGRVDLAMLRYMAQFWTSDNTDAYDRLRIQEGFSYAYPASTMRAWVVDNPQFMNDRNVPFPFRFHTAMMGALGIGANIEEWTAKEGAQAARWIAMYKEIRGLIADGAQYRLVSPTFGSVDAALRASGERETGDGWAVVEYVATDGAEAGIFVLSRGTQFGDPSPLICPEGLDEEAIYTLEWLDVNSTDARGIGGAAVHEGSAGPVLPGRVASHVDARPRSGLAWKTIGLRLWLRGDYASAVLRLRRASDDVNLR
jgi:alpha-galactosidase